MTEEEKQLLNAYHQSVYEKISPYLEAEEKEWLKEYTRPSKIADEKQRGRRGNEV